MCRMEGVCVVFEVCGVVKAGSVCVVCEDVGRD